MAKSKLPGNKRIKITLYEEIGETSRFVSAGINDNGDLVISGQDVGKNIQELFGDSDYEYWVTVLSEHKKRVLEVLIEYCNQNKIPILPIPRTQDSYLLALIKKAFGRKRFVFEKFRDFLSVSNIPFKFDNYV
ncbi:MAG: hypothetical protein HY671_04515, partial [Chloroflexi bacterium]|nr:hypothetical protein [Chloroflexota bacterium]